MLSDLYDWIFKNNHNSPWLTNDHNTYKINNYDNPIVVKCINLISQSINALSIDIKHNTHHHINQIMTKPNHYQFKSDFISTIITHKLLYGNAYIVFDDNRLYILNPLSMNVEVKGNTIYYSYNNGKVNKKYIVNEQSPCNIMHIRNSNRNLEFLGTSSLEVAKSAIEIYNSILEWNKKILKYNSQYSLAITLPSFTNHQFHEFKSEFIKKYGENNLNAIFLPNGSEVNILAKNPNDMGFEELMSLVQTQIAYAFGVPPLMINIANSTYTNAVRAREVFYESNIIPTAQYIFGSLSHFLSQTYKTKVNIKINPPKQI